MIEKLFVTKGTIKTNLPEPWNKIVVHTLTVKDRIDAYSLAKKIPNFDSLPEDMKQAEINRITTWLMIEEPKVTIEDYLQMDDLLASEILYEINQWYAKVIDKFSKKLPFLKRVKDFFQTSSSTSMNNVNMTGKEQ